MTIEEARQKAIEGGYTPHTHKDKCEWDPIDHHVISPQFWECLGRAKGEIDKDWPNGEMRCENKLGRCNQVYCEYGGYRNPYERWHRFIDHLTERKTIESFFETL